MDIKYTSTQEIRLFQEHLLRKELSYFNDRSPFYKRMFRREGIDIRKIRTLEDLQHVPFTKKSDLQQCNQDFICVPKEQLIDYVTTSGTLSDPAAYALPTGTWTGWLTMRKCLLNVPGQNRET